VLPIIGSQEEIGKQIVAPKKTHEPWQISPRQLIAARALIGWRMEDLGEAAGTSFETVRGFESRGAESKPETIAKWRKALEAAGIEFIDPDEKGGSGVRWKSHKAERDGN
jgi:transcriptional regulator with XRE-family HTH domain